MTREEVKRVMRTEGGKRITQVLREYFSGKGYKDTQDSLFKTAQGIFNLGDDKAKIGS